MKPEISRDTAVCSTGVTVDRAAGVRRLARALSLAALFAALTALCAHVRFPLPGTPVPVTLQTLPVVLAGMTMGPWIGSLSMVFYLLLGLTGYDVFAAAPAAGRAFPPTLGYLLGFVAAQPLIGWISAGIARRNSGTAGVAAAGRSRAGPADWLRLTIAPLAGHGVIFALGVAGLAIADQLDIGAALHQGFWPFVPGTILKLAAAAIIARAAIPRSRRWLAD